MCYRELCMTRTYLCTCFFPSRLLYSPFLSCSPLLTVVSQIRGHILGSSPPSPLRYTCLAFLSRDRTSIQHFLPSLTRVQLCVPKLQQALSTVNSGAILRIKKLHGIPSYGGSNPRHHNVHDASASSPALPSTSLPFSPWFAPSST